VSRLILASSSPRRKALLKQIGLDFEVIPSRAPETWDPETAPAAVARGLALRKAEDVARRISSGLVIGADTLVLLEGSILGKPASREEAVQTLEALSGKSHDVITGLAVMEVESRRVIIGEESTRVYFREIPGDEIEAYVDTGEPMDKAGAYGIQEKGVLFVRRIEGCYTNVVGLPIPKLAAILSELKVSFFR